MVQKIKSSNRRLRQVVSLLVAALLIGSISFLGIKYYNSSNAATPGSIYVTPNTASLTPGSTASFTVREDSGSNPVNSAQFLLTYNASQLQYVSHVEGGDFNFTGPTSTGEAGTIRAQRGMTSGKTLTGDHPILTINFKVLASSGSTTVAIDRSGSLLYGNGQDYLQTVSGGSYTVASASSPTPTPPAPTPAPPAPTPPAPTPPSAPGVVKDAIMSLSPASGTYKTDSEINVAVRIKSPTQKIFTVQSVITYPTNQLQYVSAANSNQLPTDFRTRVTNGTIDIVRGTAPGAPGFSGEDAMVTLKFKVIGTSGTAALGLKLCAVNCSAINDGSGNNLLASVQNASYGVGTTVAPPPPPPVTSIPPQGTAPIVSVPTVKGGSAVTSAVKQVISPRTGQLAVTAGTSGNASISGTSTQVGGEVQLAPIADTAIMADNPGDSIVKVEYYLNKKLIATKTESPFTYSFDTKELKNGSYDITVKTFYSSGAVDSSTDPLLVKNPVTLSYVLANYAGGIAASLVGLAIVGFVAWKYLWPRFSGNGATVAAAGGYNGYVGDADTTSTWRDPYQAPEPAVIAPTNAPAVDTFVAPEQAAATQTTQPLTMQDVQTYQPTTPASPTSPVASPAPGQSSQTIPVAAASPSHTQSGYEATPAAQSQMSITPSISQSGTYTAPASAPTAQTPAPNAGSVQAQAYTPQQTPPAVGQSAVSDQTQERRIF